MKKPDLFQLLTLIYFFGEEIRVLWVTSLNRKHSASTMACLFHCSLAFLASFIAAYFNFGTAESFKLADRSLRPKYLDLGNASDQYAVETLPDIDFALPANWAGEIVVPGIPNGELF